MFNSRSITADQKDKLREWWDKARGEEQEKFDERNAMFEQERELVRRLTDGE
jgi:hypothetical protein